MAIDIRRLPKAPDAPNETRPLRVLPTPPHDPIGEEWLFGTKGGGPVRAPRGGPRVNRRLVALLVLLCGAVAVALIVKSLGDKPAPRRSVARAAPAATAAPPAPQAAAQPVGIPMTIESSNVSTDSTVNTYRAVLLIRNPTDVSVADITVQVSVLDSSGSVMKTETRHLEALASGGTSRIEFTGEFDPQAQIPATVEATATAASSA